MTRVNGGAMESSDRNECAVSGDSMRSSYGITSVEHQKIYAAMQSSINDTASQALPDFQIVALAPIRRDSSERVHPVIPRDVAERIEPSVVATDITKNGGRIPDKFVNHIKKLLSTGKEDEAHDLALEVSNKLSERGSNLQMKITSRNRRTILAVGVFIGRANSIGVTDARFVD